MSVARATLVSETDLLEPIRDISHALIQRLTPLLEPAGLAKGTFWTLHHLDRGEESHPGELARRLGVTPAACTSSVDQLVASGYVARSSSANDRRQVLLVVTPKGHRKMESIWRDFDEVLRDILAGIPTEDVEVTARTLRTLAARLVASAPFPSPEARP